MTASRLRIPIPLPGGPVGGPGVMTRIHRTHKTAPFCKGRGQSMTCMKG